MNKTVDFSKKKKISNESEEIEVILTLEFKHNMISMKKNLDSYSPEIRENIIHAIHDLIETKYVSFITKFKFVDEKVAMKIDDLCPVDKEEYAELMETAPNQMDIDKLKCEVCEEKDTCKENKNKNKNENKNPIKLNDHKKRDLKNKLKDLPQMIISTDNTIN